MMLIYQLKIISLFYLIVKNLKIFHISDENATAYANLFNEAEDVDYILPKYHRCVVYTLNLIATNV